MATLIEKHNSEGKVERRCDSRCYDAKHPHCECICGGVNHGVGLKEALDRIEERRLRGDRDPRLTYPNLLLTVDDCTELGIAVEA